MAAKALARPHQQAIGGGGSRAISQAQGAFAGLEGQHARHRLQLPLAIGQLLAQQQQATAFGHQRQPRRRRPGQVAQAASARR